MSNYIKSPLNYTGGKFKLLDQILPLFPKEIKTFVDLFGGGGNVFVNVEADSYIYNDFDHKVVEILEWMKFNGTQVCLDQVDKYITDYGLSKTNKQGFLDLRRDYNAGLHREAALYALIAHGFNNQIRFNSKGEYNIPFGTNRSSFNPALREKFIQFVNRLEEMGDNLHMLSADFRSVYPDDDALVYCDPPYLISTATYNEKDGWSEGDESGLLDYLTILDFRGVKFALSNVTHHGGRENTQLIEWSKQYNVHELNMTYSNASYHKKDRESKSREVLITNY